MSGQRTFRLTWMTLSNCSSSMLSRKSSCVMPAAFTHTEGGWKYWVCERRTLTGRREQKKVGEHHHLQRYFNALTLPSHLDACDQLRHALF